MCSNNADKSNNTNIEECSYEDLIGINKIRTEKKTQEESSDFMRPCHKKCVNGRV